MKKKILFAVVTILMFTALAVAEVLVLRARDPNPDFGMVRDVYTFTRPETPITDCEGDVDILRADSVEWDYSGSNAKVYFTISKDIAFTSAPYKNGEAVGEENSYPKSHVERLEDGEWVEYGELGVEYAHPLLYEKPPYARMSVGEFQWEYLYGIPVSVPGTYRVTLYFRESETMEYYEYTTGDELYHITFTLTVPEATEKPFDVISAYMGSRPEYIVGMNVVLRKNDGTDIWLDRARITLEMLKDGEWQDVSDRVQRLEETSDYRYATGDLFSEGNTYTFQVPFLYGTIEPEYPHRLTLEFCENDDGTGERFFLTLNLRFTY